MVEKNGRDSMVSIIVPVYNVEKYLARCVDSIVSQSYKNIEIILVDDGSSDGSSQICDYYANEDQRIKVIHKKNGGISDARNVGIDNSNGEYIAFIDSDDFVHKEYITKMYSVSIQFNADLVQCGYEIGREESFSNQKTGRAIAYSDMNKFTNPHINITAWGKLYKSDLFCNTRFPVGRYCEDEFVAHELLYHANMVAIINEKLYYYFQTPQSIMRNNGHFNFYFEDFMFAYNHKLKFFQNTEDLNLYYFIKIRFCRALIVSYFYCSANPLNKSLCKDIYNIYNCTVTEILKKVKLSLRDRLAFIIFKHMPNAVTFVVNIFNIY